MIPLAITGVWLLCSLVVFLFFMRLAYKRGKNGENEPFAAINDDPTEPDSIDVAVYTVIAPFIIAAYLLYKPGAFVFRSVSKFYGVVHPMKWAHARGLSKLQQQKKEEQEREASKAWNTPPMMEAKPDSNAYRSKPTKVEVR